MNPDNKGGMTVNALLQWGLAVSIAVPILCFAILAFISVNVSGYALLYFVAAFAFITLILVFLFNQWVQRKVRERLAGLAEVCRDFTSGDRSVRAVVNGDDEVAILAMAINSLLDNQSSATGSPLGSGSDAAALQAQIEKLLQEVSAVGDGDLRVQAEVTPDTLGVLADSFNYMIEELAKVVGRVQSTAVQVTNATRRILDRSAELAQASETQVKQIAQTTEAVEALAVFIQNVARNAQMSVEAAHDALRNAANGQEAVRQTIDGMMLIRENVQETAKKIKRLGERSNEIGEIVRIIEDIADQTNLLALNAAIQSAMAGEHGRGFAVVADEIRLLAERSTESTKRIATLVKSIQGDTYEAVVAMEDSTQEVVKGSQLADEAGRSLNSIYSAVERQAQMIENIARAANEQTTVSEAVAVAMSRISEITRQTDAGTQEAAVSVSYLAELSEQLRASVSTFRLPERANDMLGTFSGMTAVTEVAGGGQNDSFGSPLGAMGGLNAGPDQGWGQDLSGNFPPLPEPGNSGALVPVSSRQGQMGQFSFNQQPDFNEAAFGQPAMGGMSPFGSEGSNPNLGLGQPNFGGQQPNFGGQQPNFGGQQPNFGGQQPNFGGQQPNFGGQQPNNGGPQFFGQQDFGDFNGFELPADGNPGFGGNQNQFPTPGGGFGNGGQPLFQSSPGFPASPGFSGQPPQGANSGLLSGPFPPSGAPRWQGQGTPRKDRNQ
jgi:methyl-accepting chemotaxis protein